MFKVISSCRYCICRKNPEMFNILTDTFFNYSNKPQYFYLLGYIYENNYKNSSYTLNTHRGLETMHYLYDNAFKLCDKMIEERNPNGYYYMSDIYYFGYGTDVNKDKSFKLLETSIELGHQESINKLEYHKIFNSDELENNIYHCKNKYSKVFKNCDSEYICFYKI